MLNIGSGFPIPQMSIVKLLQTYVSYGGRRYVWNPFPKLVTWHSNNLGKLWYDIITQQEMPLCLGRTILDEVQCDYFILLTVFQVPCETCWLSVRLKIYVRATLSTSDRTPNKETKASIERRDKSMYSCWWPRQATWYSGNPNRLKLGAIYKTEVLI